MPVHSGPTTTRRRRTPHTHTPIGSNLGLKTGSSQRLGCQHLARLQAANIVANAGVTGAQVAEGKECAFAQDWIAFRLDWGWVQARG